jgi:hypothetical protein
MGVTPMIHAAATAAHSSTNCGPAIFGWLGFFVCMRGSGIWWDLVWDLVWDPARRFALGRLGWGGGVTGTGTQRDEARAGAGGSGRSRLRRPHSLTVVARDNRSRESGTLF